MVQLSPHPLHPPYPPRTFINSLMNKRPPDPYSARAYYPERHSQTCFRHPPWDSWSPSTAPESALTGKWFLHHTSRLKNASRSGVHDSEVAFPFAICCRFHKSDHMSLCRTPSQLPFFQAIFWWSLLQKHTTLQPPQVNIGASSSRCCPQPLHRERARWLCNCKYFVRQSSASSSLPVQKYFLLLEAKPMV